MAAPMNRWKVRSKIFRTMPKRSLSMFLLGVGLLFASMGVVNDLMRVETSSPVQLTFAILASGLFSAGYAFFASTGRFRYIFVVAACHLLLYTLGSTYFPGQKRVLSPAEMHSQIVLHGILVIVFISLAYSVFLSFFGAEGKRFFAAHTEIELASAIQRALVPPLSLTLPYLEIYGLSLPSGAVGGDLLDAVDHSGKCFAYVADVAGHGVKAGVLMSMIKASVRTRFAAAVPCAEGFLDDLNRILSPITESQSYATLAFLLFDPGQPTAFSVAGHSPILHYSRSADLFRHHTVSNFPVAMFPSARFEIGQADMRKGDVIAIVTDGLTEIFDGKDQELGSDYIERTIRTMPDQPLGEMAARILAFGQQFGPARDDRTLLLIRVTADFSSLDHQQEVACRDAVPLSH